MEKKAVLLRTLICLAVVAVFAFAMHPLAPRDYYDVFISELKDKNDAAALKLVEDAKALQEKDKTKFQSQALLEVADAAGVNLASLVKEEGLKDNRDVMSLIRKKASSSIRLGLDLNGGVEFQLQLEPDKGREEQVKEDFAHYRDVAIEQLRKRLEGLKIFEAELAPFGDDYIVLRAPLVTKDEKAQLQDMIQMSAKLEFRLVATPEEEARFNIDNTSVDAAYMTNTEMDRNSNKPVVNKYLVYNKAEMDGQNISIARASRDQWGQNEIVLRFNSEGAKDFKRVTEKNINRQLAVILDGKLYCAPVIRTAIADGSAVINGRFTDDEVKTIANALQAGSFPFKITVASVFDTDPKLGAASVKGGVIAGIISMAAVAIFMVVFYRFCGLVSVVALGLNILLILGALAAFDSTLTLPGIAGIVLTIGMAVDANVLVYERIREELGRGKRLQNAIDAGYERAFSSVFDSNITTLITALILMYVGTGAVKGFAVTLTIGILSSLFTALFVTRLIYDYLFRFTNFSKISMMHFFKNTSYDFVKFWKYALIIAAAFVTLTVVMLVSRGESILGIDFTGGSAITYAYKVKGNTTEMAQVLAKAGYDEPSVTYKTNSAAKDGEEAELLEVVLRPKNKGDKVDAAEVGKILAGNFKQLGINPNSIEDKTLSGLIGKEFTKYAVIATVLALIGIGLYILLRYELVYAFASVAALLHDVVVVLGFYLLAGKTLQLSTIAAFLTVLGYSINDTVVVFDRIRENVKLNKASTYGEIVNLSINQSLNRTMLTSITTFISAFILWVAGGPEIRDFVFVMILGIICGTFSSVFLAAPFAAFLRRGKEAK